MPGRNYSSADYRYGFQRQEVDKEMLGGAVSYKYRVHDARIGRFLSIDPLTQEYPFYSPYAFSGNRLIDSRELEGLEPVRGKGDQGYYVWLDFGTTDDIENVLEANATTYTGGFIRLSGEELTYDGLMAAIDDDEDALYWFSRPGLGSDWAYRNLAKYMLGDGGLDVYSFHELSGNTQFDQLRGKARGQISTLAFATGDLLGNGTHTTIPVSGTVGQGQGAHDADVMFSDFNLAFGATGMIYNGEITISKSESGEVSFSGDVYFTWYDYYDWGPDRRRGAIKALMGIGDHWQMDDLRAIGAQPFHSRVYFTSSISGGGGTIYYNFEDSSNWGLHSEPSDTILLSVT